MKDQPLKFNLKLKIPVKGPRFQTINFLLTMFSCSINCDTRWNVVLPELQNCYRFTMTSLSPIKHTYHYCLKTSNGTWNTPGISFLTFFFPILLIGLIFLTLSRIVRQQKGDFNIGRSSRKRFWNIATLKIMVNLDMLEFMRSSEK